MKRNSHNYYRKPLDRPTNLEAFLVAVFIGLAIFGYVFSDTEGFDSECMRSSVEVCDF